MTHAQKEIFVEKSSATSANAPMRVFYNCSFWMLGTFNTLLGAFATFQIVIAVHNHPHEPTRSCLAQAFSLQILVGER
jgi:hypothetical protein